MMQQKANELDTMLKTEIPEAFPILPVSGGTEGKWAQCHDSAEYFGAQQKTELEDAHRAYDVLTKLLRENMFIQLLVGSLYPVEFQGSSHEIKIRDQFDRMKEWLDDAKGVLEQCQKVIMMGIDPSLKDVINRGNLRKLKNHIIRIGFEYVNEKKIPLHLSTNQITKEVKYMDKRINETISQLFKEE